MTTGSAQDQSTEFGSIERELYIEASPAVVYAVISQPEHIEEWWADEVHLDPTPGAVGELAWSNGPTKRAAVETITIVEADPPRRFSFRWIAEGEAPVEGNSLLATFDLEPQGSGTLLKVSETGFREKGWEAAVLEQAYNDHCNGWDLHLPRIVPVAEQLAATAS